MKITVYAGIAVRQKPYKLAGYRPARKIRAEDDKRCFKTRKTGGESGFCTGCNVLLNCAVHCYDSSSKNASLDTEHLC